MNETPDARHFRLAMQSFIGRDKIHNQTTLAVASGVSRSLINEIIHGKRFAGRMAQEKIARACGLSLADFLAMGQRMDSMQGAGTYQITHASGTPTQESGPPNISNGVAAPYSPPSPHIVRLPESTSQTMGVAALEKVHLSQRPMPMLGLVQCEAMGWYNVMDIAVSASPLALGGRSFAVMAEGESMKPEGISRGMLCYCDPDQEPLKGDAVYVGTVGPGGVEMGTIKVFWGWGGDAGTKDNWLKVRGWQKMDKFDRQTDYFIEIPGPNIIKLATVVLVRRRL
ncbi:hypothetical protein C4J81_18220 [Deltaproteobacteria bacterium Smac51]|nr:hypothetical protein C4J81_18220 [Deltaproteobacteria bacterium Smac51]